MENPLNGNRLRRQPQVKSNRGKIEIMGDILSVCIGGNIKKTHIMYKGNLSHDMLKAYTDELRVKGLVELTHSGGQFRTTDKGKEFLRHYDRIKELLSAEQDLALPPAVEVTEIVAGGSKLLSLGMNQEFLKKARISADQARDLIKGMLYLNERYKEQSRAD
ncbi:MAG TPA: winged helix-turn-helix domain-containing protein [Nitrososphaera sp.]|nr:winged helix-turn-helix domain-containing protein [Nitrososphaera sp.]